MKVLQFQYLAPIIGMLFVYDAIIYIILQLTILNLFLFTLKCFITNLFYVISVINHITIYAESFCTYFCPPSAYTK